MKNNYGIKVGQRWIWDSSELKFVVEVISKSDTYKGQCRIAQVLIGGVTDILGVQDFSKCWIYLEGQDKPNG